MIFDKEEHKKIILALINSSSFPGNILETILELKEAVSNGKIRETDSPDKN